MALVKDGRYTFLHARLFTVTSTPRRRVMLQLLILVIGLVAMLSMHEHLREQQTSRINKQIVQASTYLNQTIKLYMNSSLVTLSAIRNNISQAVTANNVQLYSRISQSAMEKYPYIYHIAVTDKNSHTRWAYPENSHNPSANTRREMTYDTGILRQSLAQQQTLSTINVRDENLYYQTYTPLNPVNSEQGVLVVFFSLSPVVEKLTVNMDANLAFSILAPSGETVWNHPLRETSLYVKQISSIPVDGGVWKIQTAWLSNPSILATNLYILNWGTGLVFLTILLITVHQSGTFTDRLRHDVSEKNTALEAANRHLLDVISERIQSEKRLEYSERRYRLLFNNANDAVFVQHILEDGRYSSFIEVNEVACNLLGYDQDTLCKHSMKDYSQPEARHHLSRKAPYLESDVQQLFETVLLHKDGHQIPVEISSHTFELMGQQTVLSIVRDITERKLAEKEVRKRQDELAHAARYASMGKLASGLAHEINQPLSAIVNYINGGLRRLEADNLGQDELKSVMQKIADQAQRAASIVSGMRDFIRKRKPRRGEIGVNTLVRQSLQLVQSEIKYNSIIVTQNLTPHPPMIVADAIQIEQVLMNLIKNAIEALIELPDNQERRLHITTETTDDNTVRVQVQDNGPGLAPEISERLFESFNTTKSQGMGLGLSICRTIIEAHGGQLWADTKQETGALFCFTIPQYHEGSKYE
ncbi:MAG TPA: PAS domain S-box protein [Gammaproteobacteria bacterium]|nr:PAS domain S-box protein [Gammaproteobacteria bacterium]